MEPGEQGINSYGAKIIGDNRTWEYRTGNLSQGLRTSLGNGAGMVPGEDCKVRKEELASWTLARPGLRIIVLWNDPKNPEVFDLSARAFDDGKGPN